MERDLVIVKDEAYTRDEWEARERQLAYDRDWHRLRYAEDADYRAAKKAQAIAWQRANPERWRQIARESAARNRPRVVGSLHSLACTGPTRQTGCRCRRRGTRKIMLYDKPR